MKDNLSLTFSALADPTRRAILQKLTFGDSNVTEIARPFLESMSLPAITKHLKVLEHAGLIEKSRSAQKRNCKLRLAPIQEVSEWMEIYRHMWEEQFDRLDEYLKEIQQTQKTENKT